MSFWRTLLDLLLPRYCAVCNSELDSGEEYLCNVCLYTMAPIQWTSAIDNPLLRILWDKFDVEAAGSSFFYSASSDFHRVFITMKYQGCPHIGQRLAAFSFHDWHARGLAKGIDCIIPVPLSGWRKMTRGYNQSEWIARGVSQSTGILVDTNVLIRKRNNETQTHKTAKQRQDNTSGIFAVSRKAQDLNDKAVLLVDDIVTTGATLCDCMRALREVFPTVRIQIYALGWAGDK